jgi:hypothetical protein
MLLFWKREKGKRLVVNAVWAIARFSAKKMITYLCVDGFNTHAANTNDATSLPANPA